MATHLRDPRWGAGQGHSCPPPLKRWASAPESVLDREGESPSQAYALRPVTEGQGVAARRGPKRLEVNCRSVGRRTRFGRTWRRAC